MSRNFANLRRSLAEAEARAVAAEAKAEKKSLIEYLEACHGFTLAPQAVTDATRATEGDAAKPTVQRYPRAIVPWSDFPASQEKTWEKLSESSRFTLQRIYPSTNQLEYVEEHIAGRSSELGLRRFAHIAVEDPVQSLVAAVHRDPRLRGHFWSRGKKTAPESHDDMPSPLPVSMDASPGTAQERPVQSVAGSAHERPIQQHIAGTEHKPPVRQNIAGTEHMPPVQQNVTSPEHKLPVQQSVTRTEQKLPVPQNTGQLGAENRNNKGKERAVPGGPGTADRIEIQNDKPFCVYEVSDEVKTPVFVVDYKTEHNLPLACILYGLKGEIRPAEDVLHKQGNDFDVLSKALVTAVITQLFVVMIRRGIRRGYIFAGEAFVFLHIPDDPGTVQYHVSIPQLDIRDRDEKWFHKTSVARIFAFYLDSLTTELPDRDWYARASGLKLWEINCAAILAKIHETARKPPRREIPHERGNRSHDDGAPPPYNAGPGQAADATRYVDGGTSAAQQQPAGPQDGHQIGVRDRPYCTTKCLQGLARGGRLDSQCPNVGRHGAKHIRLKKFLSLIRKQLVDDPKFGVDGTPLHMKGSCGLLFKIRLSSHGYTLVAKGVGNEERHTIRHESKVYEHLRSMQGDYIPVSLGVVDLSAPYMYFGEAYVSLLFLSWAGQPLARYFLPENKERIMGQLEETLAVLHQRRVLHNDTEPRNWLWDDRCDKLMLVDFERSEIVAKSSSLFGKHHGWTNDAMDDWLDFEMEYTTRSMSHAIVRGPSY